MKETLTILLLSVLSLINAQIQLTDNLGVLKVRIENINDKVEILNEDGSIWMEFDFAYEEKLSGKPSYTLDDIKELYKWQDNFLPYFFKIDYAILMFKCIKIEDDRYKVIVNKSTGETKYITKGNIWILENWPEHIVNSVVSIDFDYNKNPVKILPYTQSKDLLLLDEIECFQHPLEIKENWLKIQVIDDEGEKAGWIKWKEGNEIIISFFYLI